MLAIPVYWAALTWIPKGVMEKIRRICCRFLWAGSKESLVLPWVAWDKVARPKEWGGWGIKRLPEFSLSLAAKSGWRLITMENLWTRVVKRKYIDPTPMEDWIRSQNKKIKNISAIWKATVEAFSVIEQGLAWKVGDGRLVRIGRDPWVGCNEAYALSPGLLRHLVSKGITALNQVEKSKSGEYSPKDGYLFLMGKKGWGVPVWWAKNIWKLKSPAKARIFLWCILKRKVPTWEILQARFLVGPAWRKWWKDHPEGNLRNLPLIFCWGVWLAINKSLFQDKDTLSSITAINIAAIYSALPPPEVKNPKPNQTQINIQEGIPCGFFDGASQNNRAGAGLCIHINPDHSLKAYVGLGTSTNNYAELSALQFLLCWLLHRNINTIQIFGDSLNVINWVNGNASCQNQILMTLVEEISSLKASFNKFSICHIYRDKNEEADQLSKAVLQQDMGSWTVEEIRQGQSVKTNLPPYTQSL
eukprot:PITA_15896